MIYRLFKNTYLFLLILLASCGRSNGENSTATTTSQLEQKDSLAQPKKMQELVVGANATQEYLPFLTGKKVGITGNQSSVIFKTYISQGAQATYMHLVDSLKSRNINVVKVFAPEHGFRGTANAGEHVKDGIDPLTSIPVISLYGNNKKPTPSQLKGIDIMVFDLQDVGARFYTYISTLHYVMEACAENNIPLIVLDRPNPNGGYVDGPILDPEFSSFVGMHPVPIVHGLTLGEYAQMINGEKWLKNGLQANLKVIKIKNYTHGTSYDLPIQPSPNLPNAKAINLYPSLCFFEGTNVNAGRGTDNQFQVFGSPWLDTKVFNYSYIPKQNEGAAHPKNEGQKCYGENLTNAEILNEINLNWLISAYNNTNDKDAFFNNYFPKLAGNDLLEQQIKQGMTSEEIKETWQPGLEKFIEMREKYLLYL